MVEIILQGFILAYLSFLMLQRYELFLNYANILPIIFNLFFML